MSFNDTAYDKRKSTIMQIKELSRPTNDLQITKEVKREETELLVLKEKTIFAILTVVTLVTIIITVKIVQK